MKVKVDAKSFAEAVTWATKSLDSKDANAYVALVFDSKNKGHLFHANSVSFMKRSFSVLEVEEGGATKLALDARYLKNIAGLISKQADGVTLEYDDETKVSLKIKSDRMDLTVPLIDRTVVTEPKVVTIGEVDETEFFGSLNRIAKLCDPANEGVLPVLGAVDLQLDPEAETITMMATDRYALGEITVEFTPSEETDAYVAENKNVLLPADNAMMVAPTKGLISSATLVHDPKGRRFGYQFADGRVALFALKDAAPLAYKQLKKKAENSRKNSVVVNASELKNALLSLGSVVPGEADIYLDFSSDGIVVHDEHNTNKMNVEVEAVNLASTETTTVRFLRVIINEAFIPVQTERMNVCWGDPTQMFLFEPLLEDGEKDESIFISIVPH